MGIDRFKLSAMKPNAWFYKLRDMSRNKNQTTQHSHKKNQSSKYSTTTQPSKPKQTHDNPFNARKSYYFTRQLNPKVSHSNNSHDEPPRKKPSKQAPNSRTTMIKKPSPFESSAETEFPEPDEFRTDCLLLTEAFHQTVSMHSKSCTRSRRLDVDKDSNSIARKDVKVIINSYDPSSEFEPPLITIKKKETKPRSRFTVSSNPGVKLRINKIHTRGRRSMSSPSPLPSAATRPGRKNWDSLVIVKRSRNPERDFMESMVEMIVENKMKAWKDLEDLLASYLYLNSEEYHELIIRVFKQIWSDLRDTTQGSSSSISM